MILVTGASGTNGTQILKRLASYDTPVRAMIHEKTATIDAPNIDYIAGDFEDEASLRLVLHGVDRAFLVTNSSDRVEAQQLRFIALAREAGVRHIVYLSQLHASKNSPLRFLHYHGVVEEALRDSGIAFTNLRPNQYMQAMIRLARSIAKDGRFYAAAGDSRISVVDVRNIADVAVAALTEPGHEGKTYNLTGPEALTHAEMAKYIGLAIGRPVTFVNIPEATMREALRGFQMPAWQAEGIIEDYRSYRRGEAADISPDIERVTGTPACSFASFAQESCEAFVAHADKITHG